MQEIEVWLVLVIRQGGLVEIWNELAEASCAVIGSFCRIRERISILRIQIGFDVVIHSVILSRQATIDQYVSEVLLCCVWCVFGSELREVSVFGVFFELYICFRRQYFVLYARDKSTKYVLKRFETAEPCRQTCECD